MIGKWFDKFIIFVLLEWTQSWENITILEQRGQPFALDCTFWLDIVLKSEPTTEVFL